MTTAAGSDTAADPAGALAGRRRPAGEARRERGTSDRAPEEQDGDSKAREPAGAERRQSSRDHRKRPRRRGAALETAILEAALAELTDVGYADLRVERVAERAGASKASLYRRWPSKVELVMDAVYHVFPDPSSPPDTGSLRGDLLAALRIVAEQLAGPAGQALGGVLSEALRDQDRAQRVRSYTRGASQAGMREIVHRAVRRGEVDPAVVTERRLEAGHALLRHHFINRGVPIPDRVVVEIVDEVMLPLLLPPRP